MAQVDGSGHKAMHSLDGQLPPTYDPRCAFAWTPRSAEIARRERGDVAGRRPTSTRPLSARA